MQTCRPFLSISIKWLWPFTPALKTVWFYWMNLERYFDHSSSLCLLVPSHLVRGLCGCVAAWLRSCVVVRCVAVECLFLEPLWTSVFSLCACLSYVSLMSSREHQPWMAWLCWRPLSTNLSGVTPIAPFCSSRRTFMNYSAAICSRRRLCSSSRSLCALCSIIYIFF